MQGALRLRNEQLTHRAIIAVQKSRDILVNQTNDSPDLCRFLSADETFRQKNALTYNQHIDSIITAEFISGGVRREVRFAMIDASTHQVILGESDNKLMNSGLRFSIPCNQGNGSFLLVVGYDEAGLFLGERLVIWVILIVFFLGIIIASFLYTIRLLMRQKHLSEIKNDFVNNMTHEFKTPIATISIASEMLMKPHIYRDEEKTLRYAKIIFDENVRMMHQVEQVLQIALIDKNDFKVRPRDVQLHELIMQCVQSAELTVKKRGGEILTSLEAINDHIVADVVHLTNVINNLLDNANKYSPGAPEIHVSTVNTSDGILLNVEDKGIGISVDNQRQVFKKFYRVSTGNVHDVKGFGLGLYYVKTIVDAHGGYISLFSELGSGTRVEVFLPFINNLD